MPFNYNTTSNNAKELNSRDPPLSSAMAPGIVASDSFPNMVNDKNHHEEVSLDDDDTESVGTQDSDISSGPDWPTDPVTGKLKVREGGPPMLYLPYEEALYWGEHGHAPPGNTRKHDLDDNDLGIFETYDCANTEEDWNRLHPDTPVPSQERISWLKHG